MYAEITNIWMGNKEQRIIANLGGIFAELLYAGMLGIIYLLSQSEVFLFACMSISTFVLWEFNPFVRFDGYWLLSDLTNTPNLVVKSKRVLLNVFSKSTFQNWKSNKFKISASPQAIFLFGYGLINTFFILLLLGYTFITYQKEIIRFPFSLYQILLKISSWDLASKDINGAMLSILLFYILSIRYLIIQYKSLIK
jgi:putative peptide zinc metalloprotease protein